MSPQSCAHCLLNTRVLVGVVGLIAVVQLLCSKAIAGLHHGLYA